MSAERTSSDDQPISEENGATDERALIPVSDEEGAFRATLRRCLHNFNPALRMVGIDTTEQLAAVFEYAADQLDNGEFFLARIGRVAETDSALVMALLVIRMRWLEEFEVRGMAEIFLIDQALMAFYHQIRLHELVGNVQARAEHEFFGNEPLRGNDWDHTGRFQYKVDEYLNSISERLLPSIERCQRMLIRSLQALQRQRVTRLVIRHAEQVNIAHQQLISGATGSKRLAVE